MSASRRLLRLLAGIGLVLVGLLAGILTMLILEDEPSSPSAARIVKQVETTPQSSVRSVADADSVLPGEPVEPASLSERFRGVAERVRGAVVSVRVSSNGDHDNNPFNDRRGRQNVGSGVLISPDGYVVTNYHVVQSASTMEIRLADKRRFEGRLVGTDASTDLAVVKIDADEDVPVVPIGNSDRVQVGDWVVAIGNPFQLTSTVTAGIVSALGRQLQIIEDQFRVENFIQTDAAINPGNSGGALVNLDGELIGINTAIASKTGAYEGYGFAIPSDLVERVVTDLIVHGDVQRGYLGVRIAEVTAEVAGELGLQEIRGVYVAEVRQGSAADRAGVEDGDVVAAIQGTAVDSPNELQSIIALQRPGDVVSVRVWRDGTERTLNVQLMGEDTPAYQQWLSDLESLPQSGPVPDDERPGPQPQPDSAEGPILELDAWGVGLRSIHDRDEDRFGIDRGAYVAYVERGAAAAEAGLPRDVIITALDDQPIEDPVGVRDYLTSADAPVLVQVQRTDGTQAFYELE